MMEVIYKLSMQHVLYPDKWIPMAEGNKTEMSRLLKEYREFMRERKFRMEKHTMEVLDV